MFGIIIPIREYLLTFYNYFLQFICNFSIISGRGICCRMSVEMVACIAIEAISILEKMHSKG